MRWALGPMTGPEARQVTEWQYPAPYEMYNWAEEDDPAELLDGSYLACREESGALGGFLCFGPNATIPTREDVYRQGYLDVGLGLRPDLCGRGLGRGLLQQGLDWARRELGAGCFRLAVAQFNLRAPKGVPGLWVPGDRPSDPRDHGRPLFADGLGTVGEEGVTV